MATWCVSDNYFIDSPTQKNFSTFLKSGTQHLEGHISVKYWSIFKIKDISDIRIFIIGALEAEKLQKTKCPKY